MKNNYSFTLQHCFTTLFTLLVFIFSGITANAQLYKRTTFNSAYVPITTGGGATVSTATGNDANQAGILIGFTFNYAGNNYTSLGLNTNGLLWFDAVAPAANISNDRLFSTLAPNLCVTAWWNDLIDDASSDILYQTQGSVGNRTFTVQYTNYPNSSGTNGTNVRINCQVKLFESTGVIEYHYGTVTFSGTIGTHTGAAIGLEYGAGGKGNFIDAVTGSTGTTNRMLNAVIGWPAINYRFTPGTPVPVAGGTYNVGIGQTYSNLSLAVADLNHKGISGPVSLNLTDNYYDTTAANGNNRFPILLGPVTGSSSVNTLTISKTGTPATIAYRGANTNGVIGSYGSTSAFSETDEPILGISSSYTTIRNVNLISHGTSPHPVDMGLLVFQADAAMGAQHNLFDKIFVDLDRNNLNSVGISQLWVTGTAGISGANSYNTYRDFTIRDCSKGMDFEGAGGAGNSLDEGTQIITSSCTVFNSIGDPGVPDDIGGTSALTYGIRMHNQSNFIIRNNIIKNVTTTSSSNQVDGIYIQNFQGTSEISNNIFRTITRKNAAAIQPVTGMRLISSGNNIKNLKVFNNSVSEILSTYTGASTAQRLIKGIAVEGTGNSGKQSFEIWNNSVSITGTGSLNATNTCFELTDPDQVEYVIKNNVFANFTPMQSGVARHYNFVTPLVNRIGYSSLSSSNYNDLYIAYDQGTSGNVGLGNTSNYPTLATWKSAITFNTATDSNSVSIDPVFINDFSNLHLSTSSSNTNGKGTVPPAYVITDFDCQTRIAPHDLGFDQYDTLTTLTLVNSINPAGLSGFCGAAYDVTADRLWLYDCSTDSISCVSTGGVVLYEVNAPGENANDVDVEIAPVAMNIGGTIVPKGQLLFVNGETGVAEIYAINNITGARIDTVVAAFGSSHVVGGAYHPQRNTFFLVQDNVPAVGLRNRIAEIDAVTGALIQSFPTDPFNVSFGDIDISESGNLFVVSSVENRIAEFTPTGTLLRFHTLPAGVSGLSGLAINCDNNEAWASNTSGTVYRLGNFPCGYNVDVTLQLKLYIEGFYSGSGTMTSPLANTGTGDDAARADSVIIDLIDPVILSSVSTTAAVLLANGTITLKYPLAFSGQYYYVSVKGRNIVETWSKHPVKLNPLTTYDLSKPESGF